jgi:hypothetical protein
MSWLDQARQGKPRQGKAWQGMAWQGKARQGKARQGKARQGKARQGKARQGKACMIRKYGNRKTVQSDPMLHDKIVMPRFPRISNIPHDNHYV